MSYHKIKYLAELKKDQSLEEERIFPLLIKQKIRKIYNLDFRL